MEAHNQSVTDIAKYTISCQIFRYMKNNSECCSKVKKKDFGKHSQNNKERSEGEFLPWRIKG